MSEVSIVATVREYANAQGCVTRRGNAFMSRDGKRAVIFKRVLNGRVIVWDTGSPMGYVPLSRERRPIKVNSLKAQGDEPKGGRVGPLEAQD